MPDIILAVNAGSSSLKLALFDAGDGRPVARGRIEDLGRAPRLAMRDAEDRSMADRHWPEGTTAEAAMSGLLAWIEAHVGTLKAAGHRIVHGGREFVAPTRLDEYSIAAIAALTPLAPLHQPGSLAPIHGLRAVRPALLQVGCFDTAFHHDLKPPVGRYAIPRIYEEQGVRHYGFHGLSYAFIAGRLEEIAPDLARGRVVVAHLGSGASLCALRAGRSVDTTMGFSVLDGLVMGTRCGSLDPGVILYLQRSAGLSTDAVEHLLYHESGLLGVSGLSSDLRDLVDNPAPEAAEAVELFVFSVARHVAALVCTLSGLDGLVFTGGIGENSAAIRAAVCERLRWMGVELDAEANAAGRPDIGAPATRVGLRVIATDEEAVIARGTRHILGRAERGC